MHWKLKHFPVEYIKHYKNNPFRQNLKLKSKQSNFKDFSYDFTKKPSYVEYLKDNNTTIITDENANTINSIKNFNLIDVIKDNKPINNYLIENNVKAKRDYIVFNMLDEYKYEKIEDLIEFYNSLEHIN